MKKYSWLWAVGILVAAAAVSIIALPKGPEWTTESPAALAEFELAMEARMKLYMNDFAVHLERAVELDPDFLVAKMMYAGALKYADEEGNRDRWQALYDEVFAADLGGLRPREEFFVESHRAVRDERFDDLPAITQRFLKENPDDPYILNSAAEQTFVSGDYERSERLYRRLVELSPNWVIGYNQLGYLTMQQGRFAEAEEYFTSYRFIAPDQANPHDSLGELYLILGRYQEAAQSFETALEIKADFWESLKHLAFARALMDDPEGVQAVTQRALDTEGLEERIGIAIGCFGQFYEWEMNGAWGEIMEARSSECVENAGPAEFERVALHRAASQLGDFDLARKVEDDLRDHLDTLKGLESARELDVLRPVLIHMEGVRLALSGDVEAAEEKLRSADEGLTYINSGTGLFKLYNRLFLVETLLSLGQDAEAHRLLSKVRAVNTLIAEDFEEDGLKLMGLDRG